MGICSHGVWRQSRYTDEVMRGASAPVRITIASLHLRCQLQARTQPKPAAAAAASADIVAQGRVVAKVEGEEEGEMKMGGFFGR